MPPSFKLEKNLARQGYFLVAGVDEAGRGPWAGPIVAAAVILDFKKFRLPGVRDSKLLSEKRRDYLAEKIKECATAFALAEISAAEIDEIGLQLANILVMQRAVAGLASQPDFILADYVARLKFDRPHQKLVRGERASFSIAAASILAKVYRDNLMKNCSKKFPEYGFELHKGYGTALHLARLKKHGLTPLHRQSFAPVAKVARLKPRPNHPSNIKVAKRRKTG